MGSKSVAWWLISWVDALNNEGVILSEAFLIVIVTADKSVIFIWCFLIKGYAGYALKDMH